MKGTSFQKPLEFNLSVDGESWRQGDAISGLLKTRSHGTEDGTEAIDWSEIGVYLAHGDLKKIRAKTEGAFKIIASHTATSEESQWKFQTDLSAPVTDSTSSLFLIYGFGKAYEKLGQLQVNLTPSQVLEDFLKIFQIQHGFVRKSVKAGKGKTETKFAPPSSKEFVRLELLLIKAHFAGETLEVECEFNEKKIEASAAALEVKKQKKQIKQSFGSTQYRTSSGRFNYETMEAAVAEILKQPRALF